LHRGLNVNHNAPESPHGCYPRCRSCTTQSFRLARTIPQSPKTAPARTLDAFATPLALTAGLLALTLLPRVRVSAALTWSFWGAAALLLVWQAVLAVRGPSTPRLRVVPPRRQHYIQSLCQLSVYAYWGWYWPPVYDYAPLLVGQLLFAYVFDMLLAWSRGEDYQVGMGPFPIIFSTNLFLWFKDDWFALQFVLVAVGFLGKAFVGAPRDGLDRHHVGPGDQHHL